MANVFIRDVPPEDLDDAVADPGPRGAATGEALTDTRIERSQAPMTCQIITITPPEQPHIPHQRP